LVPARRFAPAVTASLLIAGALFACPFFSNAQAQGQQAQGRTGTCEDAAELVVLPSPIAPWKGAPLRVIFAAEAARGRAFVDRAQWERRGQVA
jgi:hypothetical protein